VIVACHDGDASQFVRSYITRKSVVIMHGVIRTQISLTSEQMARIRRAAEKRHISIAAVIRDAVDHEVPDEDSGMLARQQRAFAAAGAFASGRHDVAENHDDALAEEPRW
jgi:hypothetical protein